MNDTCKACGDDLAEDGKCDHCYALSHRRAAFSCYLGDGEFDYVTVPVAEGDVPTELGAAVDHFTAKYPDRSWRMYESGHEEATPLYEHLGPQERARRDADDAERSAEFALWLATI